MAALRTRPITIGSPLRPLSAVRLTGADSAFRPGAIVWAFVLFACCASASAGDVNSLAKPRELATRIHAVFSAKCVQCHGPSLRRPRGKFGYVLDLERMAANPDLVIPFKPEESKLWTLLRDDEMPPPKAKAGPLTAKEKDLVHDWVAAGAPTETSLQLQDATPPEGHATALFTVTRLFGWLGRFHILVLHFPIALLIAAAVAELWGAWRGDRSLETVVRFCVLLGAASAVAAVALGWLHADFGGYGAGLPYELDLHRWLGTAAGLWAVATALLCERDARQHRRSRLFRIAVLTGAILVSAAGHFGGTLVHGDGFFDW
jgi:uncharacterized membrane protein/mono/diheme cytochrome c family protein